MFTRFIVFEINKRHTTRVIDMLSRYQIGFGIFSHSDLNITNAGLDDKDIYCVSLHVKKSELERCLTELLELNRTGVPMNRLVVD